MQVISKNGYSFISGMFWQIPDEGKTRINMKKLKYATGHDLYCRLDSIRLTWGFCRKSDISNVKKPVSLAAFIITASGLTADYSNVIICYKVEQGSEADSGVREDLYGYIIILNKTICPDEGEYVAGFATVYESIVHKAKLFQIDSLYLPADVNQILAEDKVLKYLIADIHRLEYTSDEMYWLHPAFKHNARKALLKPIPGNLMTAVRATILCIFTLLLLYTGYCKLIVRVPQLPVADINLPHENLPHSVAPVILIQKCLMRNDRYFRSTRVWTLAALKCDSLANVLTFSADTDVSLANFMAYTGEAKGISLNGRSATLEQKNTNMGNYIFASAHMNNNLLQNMQQLALVYGFKVTFSSMVASTAKFTINSTLSPLYLNTHGVFNQSGLNTISMTLDASSGLYNWIVQGEF